MVKTQIRRTNIVEEYLSNNLAGFDDNDIVFIPRSTVSSEIVKLQNLVSKTKTSDQKLMMLVNSYHSQNREYISKSRFVKMSVKTVNECFSDVVITVYVDV